MQVNGVIHYIEKVFGETKAGRSPRMEAKTMWKEATPRPDALPPSLTKDPKDTPETARGLAPSESSISNAEGSSALSDSYASRRDTGYGVPITPNKPTLPEGPLSHKKQRGLGTVEARIIGAGSEAPQPTTPPGNTKSASTPERNTEAKINDPISEFKPLAQAKAEGTSY